MNGIDEVSARAPPPFDFRAPDEVLFYSYYEKFGVGLEADLAV